MALDALPGWVRQATAPGTALSDPGAALDATVQLALASVDHGGGPFGALVATDQLDVVSVGWNRVIETHDSTAHAEIVALRRAQAHLGTHDLSSQAHDHGPLTLFTSCAPCIQCFGALYWSGIHRVVAAASAEDAEALGFQEGPVTPALWEAAARDKGVGFEQGDGQLDPQSPFHAYVDAGGEIY